MVEANVLRVLDSVAKIENIVIYGNVRCAIEKPKYLSDRTNLTDGYFALVDVLALQCTEIDYFCDEVGCKDANSIYVSRGSIVVALKDPNLIGKNVKVYGKTLGGTTIKRQNRLDDRDGIASFEWKYINGCWAIVPNRAEVLTNSHVKGTSIEECIIGEDSFTVPEEALGVAEYFGCKNYVKVDTGVVSSLYGYVTDRIDLTKIPLNLVHRLNVPEVSEFIEAVEGALEDLDSKYKKFSYRVISNIREDVTSELVDGHSKLESIANGIIDSFISEVCERYNLGVSNSSKIKGKEFVDSLLDSLLNIKFISKDNSSEEDEEVLSSNMVFKEIESLKKQVALSSSVMRLGGSKLRPLQDVYQYASLIIGEMSGVGIDSIVSNHNSVVYNNRLTTEEWFWCIIRNPYLSGLLGGSLSLVDCDLLRDTFSVLQDESKVTYMRNILYMLERIKSASSKSTLIHRNIVLSGMSSYSSIAKNRVAKYGTLVPLNNYDILKAMLGKSIDTTEKSLELRQLPIKMVETLNNVGLIEEVNDGYILTSDLKREFMIYSILYKKGNTPTDISDSEIENTIDRFEKTKGFKLESLQRDGIYLVKHRAGVLSGCAGSGKTTTSDCMVEAIKTYLPGYELKFGAPTGKAARRLAEVVGGNVKTIHSMFGLGLSSEPYICTKEKYKGKNEEGGKCAYFLDEMAMSNIYLMSDIVSHLNEEDLVYFLGDIKQLSPIGKGNPFRALMSFLPCIELGVSKRAAENGTINYNCGLLNFASDGTVVELQEGDDFKIIPCKDIDIQRNVSSVFRDLLGKYNEDDIQVVTGYQNERYLCSTTQLNPIIQDIARNSNELLFMYNNKKYMVNDRVIHVHKNDYDMPRYRAVNGVYEEVVTFGVVNGELGKVLGCIKSTDVHFKKYNTNIPDEVYKMMSKDMQELHDRRVARETIRDNSLVSDENVVFVVVQVYDVDLKENLLIFYEANYRPDLSNNVQTAVLSGGGLRYLELAYALTTHKMQGSQSPVVIIPLESNSSSSFMNRNMLNTMVTRASELVVLVGSVRGIDSLLTNGRRNTNTDEGEDVLSLLGG